MVKKGESTKTKEKKTKDTPTSAVKAPKKSAPIVKDESKTENKSSRGRKVDILDYNIEGILDTITKSSGKFESPMLAESYDGSQDIDGWLMSEKLDGVRCIWNGKNLYSRNGNMFYPPSYFTASFPNMMLDGELFLSRKNFSDTISIVKKGDHMMVGIQLNI